MRSLRRADPLRRGQGLDGDRGLGDGASARAGAVRHRSRALSRLRVRLRHRPPRHAEIRHPRSAPVLRIRSSLAEALWLCGPGHPDASRGAVPMKFTLSGLRDHVESTADAATIAETATNIGLEVETIEDKGASLAAFTVARVVSAAPHPNADKLRLCVVDTGNGTTQVVCGAPN